MIHLMIITFFFKAVKIASFVQQTVPNSKTKKKTWKLLTYLLDKIVARSIFLLIN